MEMKEQGHKAKGGFWEVIRSTIIKTGIPSEGEWSVFLGQWGDKSTWGANGILTLLSGRFNML